MEIGIDLEKNERFKNLDEAMKKRAFTLLEIEYAEKNRNPEQVFCAFWCVKEAVIKAFGNRAIPFQKIEICSKTGEKPYIILNETISAELKKNGLVEIKISMSHTNEYSTGICLLN